MRDTIVAQATPAGAGGIGIIRLSGLEAERVWRELFRPAHPRAGGEESHRLMYGALTDGENPVDECMSVWMKAPYSYTREDVAEFHLHGGPYVMRRCLQLCLNHGARLAEAGEFTRRAFLNGRIDLSQAEAVMAMIHAEGEQEHRAAIRQLGGGAAAFVRQMADRLYGMQAGIAACIDYPEEISEEEGAGALIPELEALIRDLRGAADEHASRLIHDGLHVTLFGLPNVGKSSLLNALTGEEKAIVTEIPGTTRDPVRGEILVDGVRVFLTDTAGLRRTEDPVERIGVERSEKAMREADVKLLVLDASREMTEEEKEQLRSLGPADAVALNKTDLPFVNGMEEVGWIAPDVPCVCVSALDAEAIEPLKELIRQRAEVRGGFPLTQPRHLEALGRALGHLRDAMETAKHHTLDMVSVDLQAAQAALGEITGDQADEKLLDRVFASFCVGK